MIFIIRSNRNKWNSRALSKAGILVFWLVLWQLLSMWIGQQLLFAGPMTTFCTLYTVIREPASWCMIAGSTGRILLGYGCGLLLGSVTALASYQLRWFLELLAPFLTLLKSIPVASFVVLILAWLSSKNLSVLIAGLVTYPVVYFDLLHSLSSIDMHLLEMAQVFEVKMRKRFRYLYLPAMMERLVNTARLTIGMSIRAGVAAELIGLPKKSIGEAIYKAKLYFDIADLFAWTILVILVCFLCERFVVQFLDKLKNSLNSTKHKY